MLPCFSDVGACELHGQIKTASSVHLKLVECKGLGMDSLKKIVNLVKVNKILLIDLILK